MIPKLTVDLEPSNNELQQSKLRKILLLNRFLFAVVLKKRNCS
jgi:hypothetical protein